MRKWSMALTLGLTLAAGGARAQGTDSLEADTMWVDWYVTPEPTGDVEELPDFGEMTERLAAADAQVDYSEAADFDIGEPRFAWVNITGLAALPTAKTDVRQVWVEVNDGGGNRFRKRALLKAQGSWSLKFPKRNFSCQFCEGDWSGTATTGIRIGQWVRQDEFHFKAFYTDFLRGIGEVGYKLFHAMVADRRPYWERGGCGTPSQRARCLPDGFPCAVYLEGKFLGLYAWQLKKSRKNMNMERSNPLHIHLDGNLNNSTLFRGSVQWSQFEVRHPKAADCTEQTRQAIVRLSQYHAELASLEASGADSLTMRRALAERFDMASLLDYDVFYQFVCNCDGSLKNWQWFSYDGRRWLVAPYDLDQTFGLNLYGVVRPAVWQHSPLVEGPFYWVERYCQRELALRYAQLRAAGVLAEDGILPLMRDWHERVPEEMHRQERVRWPDSPCFGEAICNAGWRPSTDWKRYTTTPDYSASASYGAGDLCKLEGRLWQATQPTRGVRPYQRNSQRDSLQRLERWVADRLAYLDERYHVRQLLQSVGPVAVRPDVPSTLYNLLGQPVVRPRRGIYVRGGRKVLIK